MELTVARRGEADVAAPPVTDIVPWRVLAIAAVVISAAMKVYGWVIVWRSIGILVGAMLVVVPIGAFYHFTGRSASLPRLGFSLMTYPWHVAEAWVTVMFLAFVALLLTPRT